MNLPEKVEKDPFGPVEAENPNYWQALNEMGKRGELPERIWSRRDDGKPDDR